MVVPEYMSDSLCTLVCRSYIRFYTFGRTVKRKSEKKRKKERERGYGEKKQID